MTMPRPELDCDQRMRQRLVGLLGQHLGRATVAPGGLE